jgi:tetratricopeptide (TPR) repeat protein
MVAAALAANAAGSDAEAEGAGALARIRDHLKGKGVDALVEMIMDIAERDPALFRRLDMAAATVNADERTLEARLRKVLDQATRTRGYVDYREAAGWAEGVNSALAAWEKLPARAGQTRARDDRLEGYDQLKAILDFFAERDGDVDARVALRAKDLSSPWSYLQLSEFCLAQGRGEEAVRRAEAGLWMFEDDRPDERLVFFAAELLSNAGRQSDAQAHLQRAFERAPSLALYTRLRRLGGEAARERALKLLEGRIAGAGPTPWDQPAGLLIRILAQEQMFDAAWAAVRRHGASMRVKEALARASETTHPREAVDAYSERIEALTGSGGNPAYAEAATLIAHLGTLRGAAEQTAYVTNLRARFGRKRNLMKLLG